MIPPVCRHRPWRPGSANQPLLVQLASTEVMDKVAQQTDMLASEVKRDPYFDGVKFGALLEKLYITSMDLILRFRQYTRYPGAICRLSKKWNSDALTSALQFLQEAPAALDRGFGRVLQREAVWG